jgi:hypothetical protein
MVLREYHGEGQLVVVGELQQKEICICERHQSLA